MDGKGTLKILGLHTDTGSRFYRMVPQLRWMQNQGHQVQLERHDTPHLAELLEWCDVLILQMVFSPELVAQAKALGKKVIFECDDLIHKTHEKHYAYEDTKGFRKQLKWWWMIWRVLRQCDGFIVSTPELKRVYGWMARRTFVFPNYMELEHWLKEPRKNHSDRIRILWAGSTSHTGDLHWVKPIMAEILTRYPQVQFIYIGHGGVPTDDLYARFVYGEDIFDGLPKDRRESMLAAPANVYPYILPALMGDIAIAPLEKNDFNRYKTQCKYLEYAINGIPGVYSAWFYKDVRDGRDRGYRYLNTKHHHLTDNTGLVADTHQEWIDAISLLVEDATLRVRIGENARAEVIEKYNFTDHAPRWQGFVESICHVAHLTQPPQASSPGTRKGGSER